MAPPGLISTGARSDGCLESPCSSQPETRQPGEGGAILPLRLGFVLGPGSATLPRWPLRGLNVGGDVEQALENISVRSYVLEREQESVQMTSTRRPSGWSGDVRHRGLTSVVAAEDEPGAQRARRSEDAAHPPGQRGRTATSSRAGTRVPMEVSAVAHWDEVNGVVGVFGLFEERPDDSTKAPPAHLTPRQVEVLRLLEQGRSTKQIAAELHLSTETVRNHIRRLFRALGVNTRLEAVAAARTAPPG